MCSNKELEWNGGYQRASLMIKNENISLYDKFCVKTRVPGLCVNFAGVCEQTYDIDK